MEIERRLAAILAADVEGYSRLMAADEVATLRALTARRATMDELIAGHRGRIVGTAGDSVLAEFASVVDAVACALAVQAAMATADTDEPAERRMRFRIGVNLGDVLVKGADIFGDDVNIAARLEALAKPGGVCVSGTVRDHVAGRLAVDFTDLGEQMVKNIARPVRAYRVAARTSTPAAPSAAAPRPALPLPDKPSLAILPFANMSGDAEQEYFADGITEDLITSISKIRWLFVIARNSTFVYKGRSVDVKQVARELGVRYVLEGSVRRVGTRVRITAQLVDAESGAHHWAERYDRELDDIFALQDEIVRQVGGAIEPKLLEAENLRAQKRSSDDLDAWERVARAQTLFWRMTPADGATALDLLRGAASRYPDYAPAHSQLAFALLFSGHMGWAVGPAGAYAPTEARAEAAAAARRAADLDDEDPWAHVALGYLATLERLTADAEAEFARALALNPNFAAAHGWLSFALAHAGRRDEAVAESEAAIRLSPHDPLNPVFIVSRGVGHYHVGDFAGAELAARRAVQQRPGFTGARRVLLGALGQLGRIDEARAQLDLIRAAQPDVSLDWVRRWAPHATQELMERVLDGMRKAGLT